MITGMDSQSLQFVEILNRLKRGTLDEKVIWAHTGEYGEQFVAPLDNSHKAFVASAPGGQSVIFTMTNGEGVQTLYLDSARATDDLLRLALLQLFVAVRDSLVHHITNEALDAVKGL